MTNKEFETFIEKCVISLEEKQKHIIQKYNLGSGEDFLLDQKSKKLIFKEIKLNIIIIGSYSTQNSIWKWGWSNKNITKDLQEDAKQIIKLYTKTKFDIFLQPEFYSEPKMVNEINAMSIDILNASGYYKIPTEYGYIFLAILD